MRKILKNTFILLGILALVAVAVLGVYFIKTKQASDIDKLQRTLDTDGDGIQDSKDPDVDGDGIPNMQDPDADGDGIPNIQDALQAAETLIGRPYDQLNEQGDSVLSKLGAIVCIDVINYSFEKAGIYFEKEEKDLYKKHPRLFPERDWNNPTDANFGRRVRNFRVYCEYMGFMLPKGAALRPGDIVMFGGSHIALIEKVDGDDFTLIESSYKKIFTKHTKKADIYKRNIEVNGDPAFARITFEKRVEKVKKKRRAHGL
jgi:hypothetical protein